MGFARGNKMAKGGKRDGAGRKSVTETELGHAQAMKDLAEIRKIAMNPQTGEKTRITALTYLVDRNLGKPKEPRDISGSITVKIEGFTPDLAG